MLLPVIVAMLLAGTGPYSGVAGQTEVTVPRLAEAGVAVDGSLTEGVWAEAALLTGFSEYAPVDGRPAEDSTEVLVWYSPTAIWFGIRAFESHSPVHATLANRDRIANDDWVEILLDTFDDHRQALVFGVNPLGVQSDGTLSETQAGSRDTVDRSADYVYQSKGRVTDYGYEVEIRIPFKSIRYQPRDTQEWSLNIVRAVQHSGHQQTWTPARRAAASFLGQSGTLTGLSDLHRDLVLDVNPEVTATVNGAPGTGQWAYQHVDPNVGGNVRWGITNNLTVNGTVRPDFSQVETDASQLVFDPRQALFFPEKRPFFLEGLEQFSAPSGLIYTRRLVQPVAAVKLTGKVSGFTIGALSGVDDRAYSASGQDNPVYNILRARRDLGGASTLGLVYTDKIDGGNYNRVAGTDTRIVFGQVYTARAQIAGSFTRSGGRSFAAPLWAASLDRTGREFGFTYTLGGIDPDFVAASGFISRAGIATANIDHRLTRYGRRGAAIESWTGDILLFGRWRYPNFTAGKMPDDQLFHINSTWVVRGWSVYSGVFLETFHYDPTLYSDYALQHTAGSVIDTVPFVGTPRIPNLDVQIQVQTPQFRKFDANLLFLPAIQDENFFEWSPARIILIQAGLNWRPSDRVRVSATYLHQQYWRKSDGTTVARELIPRLKVEYQAARALFLRVVGQYDAAWQDSLRDDSRTNDPILIRNPATGVYERALAQSSNGLRVDWLVSFTPSPGTVMYVGYGSSLSEPDAFKFSALHRLRDQFFAKITYLFRA
ncbi:MAG TPA: DUF5916 domain-containing protein [Gemmatimonadales bacterium]|nr:DUF5916 domain-containing protein [Gemmatimonadales bacterium]